MKSLEHIFVFTSPEEYPSVAVDLAIRLSDASGKSVCFLSYDDRKIPMAFTDIDFTMNKWASELSDKENREVLHHTLQSSDEFHDFIMDSEASIVVFQLSEHKGFNKVKTFLSMTRNLRIPYIFVKPYFDSVDFSKVLVPVTFLVEDNEKGPFAVNMGQYFSSRILLMPAKDYGHKARVTSGKIRTVLDKYNIPVEDVVASEDSFGVELEAVRRADELGAGMVICSASRSYGLDDIVFGPKELKFINEATVPVMLLNPRADLYVLCG